VTPSPQDLRAERLLRDLAPQVLGAVVRRFHDFAASEDAVQEALIAAAAQWPRDGIPANPRGWLIQVALRRMTDHVRSEVSRRNREATVAAEAPVAFAPALDGEPEIDPDDTLILNRRRRCRSTARRQRKRPAFRSGIT
jgi:predicted RNA polymerase sigma factor